MATLIPFDNIYLNATREKTVVSGQKEKIEDARHLVFAPLALGTGPISVPFGKGQIVGLSAAIQISISTGYQPLTLTTERCVL
jgi:hypothetical protein